MARTIYIPWDDDDVHIIYASLLKQLSTGKHVALLWHVIMILCQSIFCSFSLMQCAKRKSNKYQFYSLFFYPTRDCTNNLLHSSQEHRHYTTDAVYLKFRQAQWCIFMISWYSVFEKKSTMVFPSLEWYIIYNQQIHNI